jgi:hypothetical protein
MSVCSQAASVEDLLERSAHGWSFRHAFYMESIQEALGGL